MKNIEVDGDEAVVEVNTDLFTLETVYSAAYVLIDRAYFSFDGDPEGTVEVYIKAKDGEDAEKVANEFNNELVNYAVYFEQAERNEDVRSAIIERALGTNLEGEVENMKDVEDFLSPGKSGEEE